MSTLIVIGAIVLVVAGAAAIIGLLHLDTPASREADWNASYFEEKQTKRSKK